MEPPNPMTFHKSAAGVAFLVAAALTISACGEDTSAAPQAALPTPPPAVEAPTYTVVDELPQSSDERRARREEDAATSTKKAASTKKPQDERDCGGVTVPNDGSGGDQPINIKAAGTSCETARAVAKAVTVDGADSPVMGYACPAVPYGVPERTCTSSRNRVSWTVQFN